MRVFQMVIFFFRCVVACDLCIVLQRGFLSWQVLRLNSFKTFNIFSKLRALFVVNNRKFKFS